jgi:hypothetical protein
MRLVHPIWSPATSTARWLYINALS